MTKTVRRRLVIVVFATLGFSGSLFLIFDSLRDHLVFFFSPTELKEKQSLGHRKIRIGGMVKEGSLIWRKDHKISFIVTDFTTDLQVDYQGILPDLFREGQGVVAEGFLHDTQIFKADKILAKHDETYMPPEVTKSLTLHHGQQSLKEE